MTLRFNLLMKHLKGWQLNLSKDPERAEKDKVDRIGRVNYYKSFDANKIRAMNEEQLFEYIAKLWAMLIWGNKKYVINKLIEDNGFKKLKEQLAELIWSKSPIDTRWDNFRSSIKGMGPAMMSELLCYAHPQEYILWNRRAYVGLAYLGIEGLPQYNYQLTGSKYLQLCDVAKSIANEMQKEGIPDVDLLTVDYFLWDELQVEDNLSNILKTKVAVAAEQTELDQDQPTEEVVVFLHNDIRDRIADIGTFLGFSTRTEIKVADGSKVDAVWEATIGNMGRVIYVFEVQTKGSIDSLILNLLKSLNNPAVQGVVAISDATQIEKIRKHAAGVPQLSEKLKYWDYKQVLQVYESLETAYQSINNLELVPRGFLNF